MSATRVGYVLKMFPRLSETFVLNEILELERQGVDVSTYSLMYPGDGRFHAASARLRRAVRYVPSQKHETLWEEIRALSSDADPARWKHVADFAQRYGFPRPLEFVLRAAVIAGHARKDGVEHLHAHFATIATRMAAAAGMLAGIPFSFTAHAKDIFRQGVDRELFSELVARSAFCVTVSDYNREFICNAMPEVDETKVLRIYNGVDLAALPTKHSVPSDPERIVSVGRLVPKKGFELLLEAVARCRARRRNLRLTIVGDGERRAALEALRESLGLADAVDFLGALPHERTLEVLASASVVALACRRDDDGNTDALPTVLLEALALGKPIVSTRIAGVPEIVGSCGALCDPDDVDAFTYALDVTLDEVRGEGFDPARARLRCAERFDLARNVTALRHRMGAGRGRVAAAVR